jgi:surfeit locus 1 family protein
MTRFRPAFWPMLIAGAGFLLLIGLGIWQLERLQWKTELIADRAAALAAAPVPVPQDSEAARRLDFHRVRAEGEFLHDHELFLGASNPAGTTGFHVVTPLRLADGRLLLVDRGWIPADRRDPGSRVAGQLAGTLAVEGILRWPVKGWPDWLDWALPSNDCGRNYWFWIDPAAMARCSGLSNVLPYALEAGPAANPGGLPRGGVTRTDPRNDHLQYAITWFALAAALAVIYVLAQRRTRHSEEPPAA